MSGSSSPGLIEQLVTWTAPIEVLFRIVWVLVLFRVAWEFLETLWHWYLTISVAASQAQTVPWYLLL